MKKITRTTTVLTATALAVSMVTLAGLPATASVSTATQSAVSTALSPGATVEKAELLKAINDYRVSNGLKPVVLNSSIGTVAQNWSTLTAGQGIFKHNPNFSTQIPTNWTYAAENIGAGEDVEEVMFGWQNSEMHNKVLLAPEATEIGLGYAYQGNASGEYAGNNYATAVFASYAKTPAPPTVTVVVPKAPTFTSTTYNIPSTTGVTYKVNGTVKASGTYPGSGTVAITANANTGYSLSGTSSWSNVFVPAPTPAPVPTPKPEPTVPTPTPAPVPTPKPEPTVRTPIAIKAASLKGALGSATSGEISGLKNGGKYQKYQRGYIYWTAATGAKVVQGSIRNVWAASGAEKGIMGYPTTDEYKVLTGVAQNYQGGKIFYTPQKGTFILRGGIGAKWQEVNGASLLGLPLSNEIGGLRNGGVYQKFQKGVIYWSPATGSHVSMGAIRNAYAKIGYEKSRLGYPITDEYKTSTGVAQKYQGGIITWTSKTGAVKVTYK